MKSFKIAKILNLLTTGIVVGGAATAGVYFGNQLSIKNGPQDDTRFDISVLNGQTLNETFAGTPDELSLVRSVKEQFSSLTSQNQLRISEINPVVQNFTLSVDNNSETYVPGKTAVIRWNVPVQDNDFTLITGSTFGIDLACFDDTASTRNAFLNSMKIQFPALDVNQLYIDQETISNDSRTAIVRVTADSTLYDSTKTATAVAGTVNAFDLSFGNNCTLTQSNKVATAALKFHGDALPNNASGLTWDCPNGNVAPLAFSNGVLTLTSGTNFAGGMFTITATYVNSGQTYVSRQNVYVQAYSKIAIAIDLGEITNFAYSNVTALLTSKGAVLGNSFIAYCTNSATSAPEAQYFMINGTYYTSSYIFMSLQSIGTSSYTTNYNSGNPPWTCTQKIVSGIWSYDTADWNTPYRNSIVFNQVSHTVSVSWGCKTKRTISAGAAFAYTTNKGLFENMIKQNILDSSGAQGSTNIICVNAQESDTRVNLRTKLSVSGTDGYIEFFGVLATA